MQVSICCRNKMFLQKPQTGHGANPASCSAGSGISFSWSQNGRRVRLPTHLRLVTRLRMTGVTTPHTHACVTYRRKPLPYLSLCLHWLGSWKSWNVGTFIQNWTAACKRFIVCAMLHPKFCQKLFIFYLSSLCDSINLFHVFWFDGCWSSSYFSAHTSPRMQADISIISSMLNCVFSHSE